MSGKPGKGTGPRPHTWVTGPDPEHHAKYIAWQRARAQANYRKEEWQITFQDWVAVWGENWHRRGRSPDSLVMMRRRWQEPWTKRNAQLVDRPTFHARQARIKKEKQMLKDKDD